MKISDLVARAPVVVECDVRIDQAAKKMAEEGVGALVVVDREVPIGIVTDRDIVTRGVARSVPSDARIDSLMTQGLIGLDATDTIDDLFALFAEHVVRRIAVVDGDEIVSIVSVDDAVVAVTSNMADLAAVFSAQILLPHARDDAPLPVPS
jgi:signal-transduction protein with cAMP-binding, CBS, and nucleotidyltransferase domain